MKQDTYALYLASRHPRVPWVVKVVLIVVVAYAVNPIDLIPDFVPVIGYLDDMVLLALGIALAIKLTPREVWAECKEQARTRLTPDLPRSRVAAAVVVIIWIVALGVVAWLVWWLLNGDSSLPSAPPIEPTR